MLNEVRKQGENGILLFIAECAAFAYSVLQHWGIHIHYPIAAVINEPEMADEMAEKLGVFYKKIVSLNLPPFEFHKILEDFKDDLCIIVYTHGRYACKNAETLLDLIVSGGYGNVEMNFLPLFVFARVIPENFEDKFALIIEMSQADMECLDHFDFGIYLERLKKFLVNRTQIVEYELHRCKTDKKPGRDSRFWSAVLTMVETVFLDNEEGSAEKLKNNFSFALSKGSELAESYELKMQISQLFRDVLDEAIPGKCTFLQESAAAELSEEEIEKNVLFDDQFYYISDGLFSFICEPLKAVCTLAQIKAILASEGILCIQGQNRSYYSVKKKISKTNRFFRCIWLCRNVLEQNVELTFLDMFKIRGKKHE